MAKKHQLVNLPYSDAALIGVASQLPDYRLVHFINKNTDLKLVKVADLSVSEEGNSPAGLYPFFTSYQKEYGFHASLIKHYPKENPTLFFILKNVDYILVILNLTQRYDLDGMIRKIRSIKEVIMIQKIDHTKIAGLDKILNIIELHVNNSNHEPL